MRDHEQEHQHGDDHRIAEVRGLALRDARAADRWDVDRAAVIAEEAVAAVGEVRGGQDDGDRAGEHQRDQREVQPAEPQGRQAHERAQHHGDQARRQQHERVRQRSREQDPRGHPRSDRQHRGLAERHHADPADQHAETEGDDRVDRHLSARVYVVGAQQGGQHQQDERQQYHDHDRPGHHLRFEAAYGSRRRRGDVRRARLPSLGRALVRLHAGGFDRLHPLPPDGDHAPAVLDQQRDRGEHERRHVAVVAERLDRRDQRVERTDDDRRDERDRD